MDLYSLFCCFIFVASSLSAKTPVSRSVLSRSSSSSSSSSSYSHQFRAKIEPDVRSQRISSCQRGSCYPVVGNLLIGREKKLSTNSTCGLHGPENYCIVSHLEERSGHMERSRRDCFVCDSRSPYGRSNTNSHRIENIVPGKDAWWQARPGANNVYIQLDLEAEFHFTHIIITFKTFRPAAMIIERSFDFGKSWRVYRYFAHNCAESFPRIPTRSTLNLSVPICDSQFSKPIPSSRGEVIMRVLSSNKAISKDPYSEEVQSLIKVTNLRINFTKLHALGDDLFQETAKQNYYYAIHQMIVRGSCSCYGHASRCIPLPGEPEVTNMVYGQCECNHHTTGYNCERCEDSYNDLPWRPALGDEKNECKKCNCNGHSSKCHFDAAVYVANNMESGGVCDDCQHNTMGQHCEECQPHYYHNPSANIGDVNACLPCDCDPSGSESEGECDLRTDHALNLMAGKCRCKRFVEGQRCDTCKDGYWNLRKDNEYGCEPCSCNADGTVPGYECQSLSGQCQCKRSVTGRSCDRCLPGYWGLGTDPQGCKQCNCDLGGSYEPQCDHRTGQCRCRPNITGRHCNQLAPQHFYPLPDWLMYEAEFATGSGQTEVVHRERHGGQVITWTGPGFMRVSERSSLEFRINDVPFSMEYDLVIRYESSMPHAWKDAKVTIKRLGHAVEGGFCANLIPQDSIKTISLSQGARHVVAQPSTCFERGASYVVTLDFGRYGHRIQQQDIHLLIDSLILLPGTSGHPLSRPTHQTFHDMFRREGCNDRFFDAEHSSISDICRKLIFSSSAIMHDGAKACECDPYGSLSATCEPIGGQCQCKDGVYGRKCDQCSPGYFGLSFNGCTLCNCHGQGSTSRFCDQQTGQCPCRPDSYGLRCGSCQRGYWGFPNCKRCECGGRSDECDDETGVCQRCRDNSGGDKCERCADGYYGDLRRGCQKCMCPGINGAQHASSCSLDQRTNRVVCNCRPGYTGENCDRCADNHFGNPMVQGGSCQPCNCNNNIDMGVPGSCDPHTGECLRCLYNTEGRSCERCLGAHYGDARRQDCRACVCNIVGTRQDLLHSCNPESGQCACLPNVVGKECDRCEPNFWNLGGGRGCEPCNCHPEGSLSHQCNEFDGQCQCKPDYGGRDCSGCGEGYWGDKRTGCQPCRCDHYGSINRDCDKRTGACHCRQGVAGYNCDQCARGTTGTMPHCEPCGPCYDEWDKIIREISVDLGILIDQGRNIRHSGSGGQYDQEFINIERMLEEIRRIILSSGTDPSRPTSDISHFVNILVEISSNLTNYDHMLNGLDRDLLLTSDQVKAIIERIHSIRSRVSILDNLIYELKKNATSIQEQDVTGAFESIKESYNRSVLVQTRVHHSNHILQQSVNTRGNADRVIDLKKSNVDANVQKTQIILREIHSEIIENDRNIIIWNNMVCDSKGNACDQICGGAGCGHCGRGLTCQEGSMSKALAAHNYSMRAQALLEEKRIEAQRTLAQMEYQKQQCLSTKYIVENIHKIVLNVRTDSAGNLMKIKQLTIEIHKFLSNIVNKPDDVHKVIDMILSLRLNVTEHDIAILIERINTIVPNLSNIDYIIESTRSILSEVYELERQANESRSQAERVRNTAWEINSLLNDSRVAQDSAEVSISRLRIRIDDARRNFEKIEEKIEETGMKSNFSSTTVFDVQGRVSRLNNDYIKNSFDATEALAEARGADELAQATFNEAEEVNRRFRQTLEDIRSKGKGLGTNTDRANLLKVRAAALAEGISNWNLFKNEWDKKFEIRDSTFRLITQRINIYSDEMSNLIQDIKRWERFLMTCS